MKNTYLKVRNTATRGTFIATTHQGKRVAFKGGLSEMRDILKLFFMRLGFVPGCVKGVDEEEAE